MKSKPFKLALIQMQVKGGDRDWNIRHAITLISEAASNGADVALLPECMDLGWTHPSSIEKAEAIPEGQPCQSLIKAAKHNYIYVCAGLTERSNDQNYNAAVIIDKQGKLLCKHRKLNELDIGHEYYAQGDRLNVVHTEFGTFGLMICADGFAKDHVIARSLCYMGADVILSPSAWAVAADHDNIKEPYGDVWRNSYIPVAREFSTAIFGVSNVGSITDGPWKGRNCIGCSLAIDSNGQEILKGPYGIDAECILYVDVMPTQRLARGTK
jgi:predicted amidohydrolase